MSVGHNFRRLDCFRSKEIKRGFLQSLYDEPTSSKQVFSHWNWMFSVEVYQHILNSPFFSSVSVEHFRGRTKNYYNGLKRRPFRAVSVSRLVCRYTKAKRSLLGESSFWGKTSLRLYRPVVQLVLESKRPLLVLGPPLRTDPLLRPSGPQTKTEMAMKRSTGSHLVNSWDPKSESVFTLLARVTSSRSRAFMIL